MTGKLQGNKFLMDAFGAMCKSGRLPHTFIIYGEKGLGKKSAASYMAKTILCQKGEAVPCENCRSCRNIDKNIHPDFIIPKQSGKLMTYSVETCRGICADSIVAPNNGDRKIYFFPDADNMLIPAQNSLLKLIEEPPDFVYFIFTVKTKEAFLPTILSRAAALGVSLCTHDECAKVLAEKGYDSGEISEALEAFGGNIGMCLDFLENEKLRELVKLTKTAADSIINRDEYELLKIFSHKALWDRNNAEIFLEMLDRVIRDAAVIKYNRDAREISCCPKEAKKLSRVISEISAERMHGAVRKCVGELSANVNSSLVMAGFCAEIMDSGRL